MTGNKNSLDRKLSLLKKKKIVKLKVYQNTIFQEVARAKRKDFFEACHNVLETRGGDIEGFAIVVWGKRGDVSADYECGEDGPISDPIMPDFVRETLSKYSVVRITEEKLLGEGLEIMSFDDEPPTDGNPA